MIVLLKNKFRTAENENDLKQSWMSAPAFRGKIIQLLFKSGWKAAACWRKEEQDVGKRKGGGDSYGSRSALEAICVDEREKQRFLLTHLA
jgi:hypothetical protein